ncbi:MAG: hypothetical protein NTV05_16190 [Acidobacteria bacterium]|nr:hypothetical protein [Acidobacteriota bacterium]
MRRARVMAAKGRVGVIGGGNSAVDAARSERYVDPAPARQGSVGAGRTQRLAIPHVLADERRADLVEVEQVVTEEAARREAGRCLRCDLDFDGCAQRN